MAGTTRITLVGVLMAVLAAVGCAPQSDTHNDPTIIGDSITVGLQRSGYGAWFGPEQRIDAVSGRAIISGGLDAVRAAVPHTWVGDKIVIELGTNDVGWHPGDANWYRSQIASVLDAIPLNRCVAWVLPYRRGMETSIRLWNNIVIELLWQRPCFAIIDWNSVAAANPGFLGSDGIHLSASGNEELANEILFGLSTMVLPPVLIPPETVVIPSTTVVS